MEAKDAPIGPLTGKVRPELSDPSTADGWQVASQ